MRCFTIFAATAAAVIAGYLGYVSWQTQGTPWGCGAGSGCEDVFRSRWSTIGGIPVGLPASVAYLALAALTLVGRRDSLTGSLRLALAAAILTADLWFVALQLFVLRAICPWCMADHALGITAAALTLISLSRAGATRERISDRRRAGAEDDFDTTITPSRGAGSLSGAESVTEPVAEAPDRLTPILLGIAAALAFIGIQSFIGKPTSAPVRLPADSNADTGPGPDRAVAVLQGRLQFAAHDVPIIGSPDAPKIVVVLFDYACPHCQATHAALRKAHAQTPDDWSIVLLPTPLNASCNPAIEETEDRFKDSCDLARAALAVWRAAPDQFPDFDEWLFEPDLPRSAAETLAEARRILGDRTDAAMTDPWIADRIRADVDAYQKSGVKVLPLVLSPGAAAIVGRTDDDRSLYELLHRDFGLPMPGP
jgi:uncharacterized membrane protein/protein-disulfide isomerase